MHRDSRNIIIVAATATALVLLALPMRRRQTLFAKKNYPKPSEAKTEDKTYENAVMSIKALRLAKKNNASATEIRELKEECLKEYGIKLAVRDGLIYAYDSKGAAIAEEQKK